MGRKPTTNLNLPPRMRARRQKSGTVYYYYDHGGKPRRETALGADYINALRKYTDLEQPAGGMPAVVTFKHLADRYTLEVIPKKGTATQKDNLRELRQLSAFFANPPAPLDQIEPISVRQYLDWRGQGAKTRANREKALLSHMWNCAREWGYTSLPNPCQGVKGNKEKPRDVYVDDAAYRAVWEAADQPLRDAMDLALFTGQRPGDVLRMSETDIRDGALWVQQSKTGARLRIVIEGRLAALIARIATRKAAHQVRSLRLLIDNDGVPLSATGLRSKFDKARELSGQKWQFRDLRAKAGTEADIEDGIGAARDLLGHTTEQMTTSYIRHRAGKLVKPNK